jgi:hypothetical protein
MPGCTLFNWLTDLPTSHLTNSLVIEPKVSALVVPKPTTGHEPDPYKILVGKPLAELSFAFLEFKKK